MAELFDIDLIPRILSLDRKVRLSGMQKHPKKKDERERDSRSRRFGSTESAEDDTEKHGTVDITV
jgi:hypothetical protein